MTSSESKRFDKLYKAKAKPPQIRSLHDILTQKEVTKILVATRKRRYGVFLYTVYSLGLRHTLNGKVKE